MEDKVLKISNIAEGHIDEKSLKPMTDEEIENIDEMLSEIEGVFNVIMDYIRSDPGRENNFKSLQSETEHISDMILVVGNPFQNKNKAQEFLNISIGARFKVSLVEAQLRLMEFNLTVWHEVVALNQDSDNFNLNDFNKCKIFILRMKKKYQEDLVMSKQVLDELSK